MDRLTRALHGAGLEACILRSPASVFHACAFRAITDSRPVLLVGGERPFVVLPLLELDHARSRCVVADLRPYDDGDFGRRSPLETALHIALEGILEEGGTGAVGLEEWALPHRAWEIAVERLGAERVRPLRGLVEELRLVKSAEEIERIRLGSALSDWAMAWEFGEVRPGDSELEAKLRGNAAFMREAARSLPGRSVLPGSRPIFGARTAVPHAACGDAVLRAGDVVIHGVGFTVDGMHCENERCRFVGGEPSAEARRAWEAATAAQKAALAMIAPGVEAAAIHARACAVIEERGFGDRILHRTGHGMGVEAHEAPYLAAGETRRLAPGMIVTCEPGIYVPGLGGFRHSDTVLVTEEGAEILTRHDKAMVS